MADQRLKDRIVIITGASSGIGRATAIKFANSGARIICADLKSTGVEDTLNATHGPSTSTFIPCDVTQESQIANLISSAVEWGGLNRLDCMLNFAGIGLEAKYAPDARIHDWDVADFDKTIAVNTRGVWLCCKYALKQMVNQEPLEKPNGRGERTRGWIVNCASMLGTTALPNTPAYVPSKFAVVGLTKQLAVDYAKDRIHINALCPGFIDTPIVKKIKDNDEAFKAVSERHPWGVIGRPEDVADAAIFLCGEESSWITGHPLVIDGGYTAL